MELHVGAGATWSRPQHRVIISTTTLAPSSNIPLRRNHSQRRDLCPARLAGHRPVRRRRVEPLADSGSDDVDGGLQSRNAPARRGADLPRPGVSFDRESVFRTDRWTNARIAVLDALQHVDKAQALRLAFFQAQLSPSHLRAYLNRLPDFDDVETEDRALDVRRALKCLCSGGLSGCVAGPRARSPTGLLAHQRNRWRSLRVA